MHRIVRLVSVAVLVGLPVACVAQGSSAFSDGDWPYWGADGGDKYSPLSQVTADNVEQLELVWSWDTGEEAVRGPRQAIPEQDVGPGKFETTPLVINDTMYLSTPYNRVVALDASTGEEFWSYDPRPYEWGDPPNGTGLVHRGVAIWSGDGERRVFINSRWRLIALDAATGEPVDSFGHEGSVDLTEDLIWHTIKLHFTSTSPPVVYGDLVIVGNGTGDRLMYRNDPPGTMQAFDVHTGERVWRFDLVPQEGDFGNDTWKDGSWQYTGHTNAWAPFTLDRERGYLYIPVGTPSNDWYGGHRKGDNLFAETLLCLDAETGERVWHYQTVHHGLWDYDMASPPTLLTTVVDGDTMDVVAAPAKTGWVYVFDRDTGEPVWPIEEKAVPQSDVPGEETSPTQPHPTKPAPFSVQGFGEDDLIDFTPELREMAEKELQKYRHGPIFTPPSLEGTIVMPHIGGGANWGGAGADPETGVLYVRASNSPSLIKIQEADPELVDGDYAVNLDEPLSPRLPNGLPISKPPYGTLTAIDLNTGEHLWQVPVGDSPEIRFNPALRGVDLPERLGAFGYTGPVVTSSGLLFIGAGTSFYALDETDGTVLWEADLGGRANGNSMTYRTSDGRQHVAVAVGSGENAVLKVFALPQQ